MEAVPKIEGHAAFYAHLRNNEVEKARFIGLENDRFIEKILVGREFWEAPIITSRICGICPVIHNVTSTKAIEAACGITPSDQTIKLRELMLAAQMIQSHSLHLYLLVLPDYVGVSSSFELQKNHPDLFKNAIELKKFADKIIEVIGGRAVHPITNVPGGFKSYPAKSQLKELIGSAQTVIEIAESTLRLFASFDYPEVERKIIDSALHQKGKFAYYEGDIWTSTGQVFEAGNYTDYIDEELKEYTSTKFGTLKGKIMQVGAAARTNLNIFPNDFVKDILKELGIKLPFLNPFDNILAQAIENYYFVIHSVELLEELSKSIKEEHQQLPKKFGIGTAACEAPRGTLFHHYELDDKGRITSCDLVTPTVQNLPALEKDMALFLPKLNDLSVKERNKNIEMLIRAYDPCITCATH
ncbi:MAG: Ni/Fe hydrogenase subunit alpha [Patescibacteria group bacterium]